MCARACVCTCIHALCIVHCACGRASYSSIYYYYYYHYYHYYYHYYYYYYYYYY